MQIARLEIIARIALVLLIFSEMVTPGVTPNVQNTTIAHKTKYVLACLMMAINNVDNNIIKDANNIYCFFQLFYICV